MLRNAPRDEMRLQGSGASLLTPVLVCVLLLVFNAVYYCMLVMLYHVTD